MRRALSWVRSEVSKLTDVMLLHTSDREITVYLDHLVAHLPLR